MQGFELKDLLQALGPTASLIFAAWIFLSFLQTRYTAAYERYRALIDEFRQHGNRDRRRESLHEQILEYKLRCEQMRRATNLGVIAAIALIAVLFFSALNVMNPNLAVLKYLVAACALAGLLLVIWAAAIVIKENSRLQLIIDSDLSDVAELREGAADPQRVGAQTHARRT
jgi:Mn2+/Fe2+ NRAMP family transporter